MQYLINIKHTNRKRERERERSDHRVTLGLAWSLCVGIVIKRGFCAMILISSIFYIVPWVQASLLQVEVPELYIRQDPTPDAYTVAITGRKPFIVMHTSLVECLSPAEVQCVLAHELGHLKCNHGIWLTTANLLALGAIQLLPMISSSIQENFLR